MFIFCLDFGVEKRNTPFFLNYVFRRFLLAHLIGLVVLIKMRQFSRLEDPCIPLLKPFCFLFFFDLRLHLPYHINIIIGHYSPESGMSRCLACKSGFFQSEEASSFCHACADVLGTLGMS